MTIREKLLNSTFGRNLLALLHLRSRSFRYEYEFEAYFQYKIGLYERGYVLCFAKPPNKRDYKTEIFNKMWEFQGHDLASYLDYHYVAYQNKTAFIRFLRYEVQETLKLKLTRSYRLLFETAFEWVKEQEALLSDQRPSSLPDSQLAVSGNPHPDRELPPLETEWKMEEMTRPYTGKIAFNNQHHKEKFIQLLILLQNLKAPGTKSELLFHRFTATDVASILRQLEENNSKKDNTLQGYVTRANQNLDPNDPRVQKLEAALLNFFYH